MIICKFFKDHKVHSPYGLVHFFWSLKNLLALIYSKFSLPADVRWGSFVTHSLMNAWQTNPNGRLPGGYSKLHSKSCDYLYISLSHNTKISFISTIRPFATHRHKLYNNNYNNYCQDSFGGGLSAGTGSRTKRKLRGCTITMQNLYKMLQPVMKSHPFNDDPE